MVISPFFSIAFSTATTIVGVVAKIILSHKASRKGIAYTYLIFTLVTAAFTVAGSIYIFPFMLCLIGLIYYVPTILLVIASVKLLQATK